MRRVLALLGLPLLVVAAGCAPAGSGPSAGGSPAGSANDERFAAFGQRADEVADGWRPGTAWTGGYLPLQEPTVLLGDPGFSPDTEQAFRNGWYREQIEVPTARPADGAVRFPDGTLTVKLLSAAEAYRQLDQGDPPPCAGRPRSPGRPAKPGSGPIVEPGPDGPTVGEGPYGHSVGPNDPVGSAPASACVPLTVTAVTLGTAPVRTSRGEAQVPAWLFTVDELTAKVARLAVVDPAAPPQPTAPTGRAPDGVVGAQDLRAVDGAKLTWQVGVGACDTGITPLVQERDDVVVVGGGVVRGTGVCIDLLKLEPVTATLKAPLGNRPVLDVVTGAPLVLRP
ncbi:hypothetical protein O7628_19240 [Micromonospora sp. WMMD956]|uniref:hypothetical protein n=1 Tax=Micromonospora TaxID=1873 RepID=UPI0024170D06|nr:hypothetical protein [Micromonospora sp. WMMD956]MDG4817627.1 hypothetical protein [Micromonospora sp. WMMD956]